MVKIIEKTKKLFEQTIKDFESDPYKLQNHVFEVEKWAHFMLKKYPKAKSKIVLLAVWLHDIGHYPIPTDKDHAIRGEQRAKVFLKKENLSKDEIKKVLHCVRSHRCNDILPISIEAKIIAFADSAAHLTDDLYFDIARKDKENKKPFKVYLKMERDLRDLSLFPNEKKKILELSANWKKLLKSYEKINI